MAKHKKKRPRKRSHKQSTIKIYNIEDYMPDESEDIFEEEQKQLSLPKKILAVIIAAIITFGIMYCVSKIHSYNNGYESPKSVVTAFINGVYNNDTKTLRRCFYNNASDYTDTLEKINAFAETQSNNITIEKNITVQSESNDVASSTASPIEIVTMEADIQNDGFTFHTQIRYEIKTKQIHSKWYIDFVKNVNVIIKSVDTKPDIKTLFPYGNDTVGCVYLSGSNWNYDFDNISENDVKIYNDKNAIELKSYENQSLDDTIKFVNDFANKDSCELRLYQDTNLNGIPAKNFVLYHSDKKMYQYIWVYRQPLMNDNTNYISLITTDGLQAYPYIMTYQR